jgi:hypothetical protein
MAELSKYQFLLYNSGLLIADISGLAEGRSFKTIRNRPDEIEFTINIDKLNDLATRLNMKAQDLLQAGNTEVRVNRFGTTLIAGQIMNWDAELSQDRKIRVFVRGWLELFKYRLTSNSYTSQTANYIAWDIMNTSLLKTYGNIAGFAITRGLAPAVDMTNSYATKLYENKDIYTAIVDMSEEYNGFDFEITWDKIFNLYFPHKGIVRADIVFSYPGNVKDIKISKDSTKMINSILGRGKGYGADQITTAIVNATAGQTYGLRESVVDYTDVADITQLTNLAQSELNIYNQPLTLHEVIIDTANPSTPTLGSYRTGDQVQVFVQQLPLYSDINKFFTIDSISVTLGDDDEEEIKIALN